MTLNETEVEFNFMLLLKGSLATHDNKKWVIEYALECCNDSIWRWFNETKAELILCFSWKGVWRLMIPKNDRLVVEIEQISYSACTIMITKVAIEQPLSAIVTVEWQIVT